MNEPHWKHLADTLETRQGLRWAFIEWMTEGRRLKAIAPLDFLEVIEILTEEQRPKSFIGSPHRKST